MAYHAFVIGTGEAYVTPSIVGSTLTLTLPSQDSTGTWLVTRYAKLRNVDIRRYDPGTPSWATLVKDGTWLSVGQRPKKLFLRTRSLYDAVNRLRNSVMRTFITTAVQKLFGPAADPSSTPLGQTLPVESPCRKKDLGTLISRGYKITTAVSPSKHLAIVASRRLYEGATKVHKLIIVLHATNPEDSFPTGTTYVLSKAPHGKDESNLDLDFQITQSLCFVPNIIHFIQVVRGCGNEPEVEGGQDANESSTRDGDEEESLLAPPPVASPAEFPCPKYGLISQYFDCGDLEEYLDACFSDTPPPHCPRYHRMLALSLAYQVADTLSQIHRLGYIHLDVKPENILLQVSGPYLRACICDFCLAYPKGEMVIGTLGTYPPPESLNAPRRENPASPSVDAWAFGIVLYVLIHGRKADISGFHYKNSQKAILAAREQLIGSLAARGENLVEDLIRQLLSEDPRDRPSMAHAAQILMEGYSFRPTKDFLDKNPPIHK